MLKITYGYPVEERNDYLVNIADVSLSNFAQAISPGAFIVDMVPMLQYLPGWFPGMTKYWRTVSAWGENLRLLIEEPFKFTTQQIVSILHATIHIPCPEFLILGRWRSSFKLCFEAVGNPS